MVVNEKSWHYYLLKTYGKHKNVSYHYPDSCSYISGVFTTALAVAFITTLCSLIFAFSVGQAIIWLIACAVTQTWIMADPGVWVFGGIVALCLFSAGGAKVLDTIRYSVRSRVAKRTPGFFSQAYTHMHNKFCSELVVQYDGGQNDDYCD